MTRKETNRPNPAPSLLSKAATGMQGLDELTGGGPGHGTTFKIYVPQVAKALLMTRFTADVIAQRGVLAANVAFIGKSFSRDPLAHKAREVLET